MLGKRPKSSLVLRAASPTRRATEAPAVLPIHSHWTRNPREPWSRSWTGSRRVLPRRDWEERERDAYQRIRGAVIRRESDGALVLPCLAGEPLATLLTEQAAVVKQAEPGCLVYRVHRSIEDPELFLFYETYVDAAAFEAHRTSPHMAEFRARRDEQRLTDAPASVQTFRSLTA